jgi:hypothetical protein
MIIFKEETRYPTITDKFFVENGNINEVALLHRTFQELGSYADSYQFGALLLIEKSLQESTTKDFTIYPIVFLIRHYIELRLKELIQGLSYCTTQQEELKIGHKLDTLWEEFKVAYSKIGEKIDAEVFKSINNLIIELSNIDSTSMAYRYPIDKDGTKFEKPESINISNLKETFIRVCFVFDGIAMQISHYVDMTEDMMMDAYNNY